jgi:hypothetical protein
MWYRKSQNLGGYMPSKAIDDKGINGPHDEFEHSDPNSPDAVDDPYVVGRTKAIDTTDEILKDPRYDAYGMTMEEKLLKLHQEPMNKVAYSDPKLIKQINELLPYEGLTIEQALQEDHQEDKNIVQSLFDANSDAYTVYKGNNSATVAKSYENQPAMVPTNRPATQYSR